LHGGRAKEERRGGGGDADKHIAAIICGIRRGRIGELPGRLGSTGRAGRRGHRIRRAPSAGM
jgi:hypothetical protein